LFSRNSISVNLEKDSKNQVMLFLVVVPGSVDMKNWANFLEFDHFVTQQMDFQAVKHAFSQDFCFHPPLLLGVCVLGSEDGHPRGP